jgi:hypothetical protein
MVVLLSQNTASLCETKPALSHSICCQEFHWIPGSSFTVSLLLFIGSSPLESTAHQKKFTRHN